MWAVASVDNISNTADQIKCLKEIIFIKEILLFGENASCSYSLAYKLIPKLLSYPISKLKGIFPFLTKQRLISFQNLRFNIQLLKNLDDFDFTRQKAMLHGMHRPLQNWKRDAKILEYPLGRVRKFSFWRGVLWESIFPKHLTSSVSWVLSIKSVMSPPQPFYGWRNNYWMKQRFKCCLCRARCRTPYNVL